MSGAGAKVVLWTQEQTAELLRLRRDLGLSMTRIATRMGMSKNAIIGRLHRLGCRDNIRAKPRPYPRLRPPKAVTLKVAIPKAKFVKDGKHAAPGLPVMPRCRGAVSIMRATRNQCRYIGDRPALITADTPIFCGLPTGGGSWCSAHHAVVLVPTWFTRTA